jgi:hypothetical protein
MAKVNDRPRGENPPNVVTLLPSNKPVLCGSRAKMMIIDSQISRKISL